MLIKPDSDPEVEKLHGPVEVLLRSGGDDMVMVGHEDDMVDEKVMFFLGFRKCIKDDACDVALIEPECPFVGPAVRYSSRP